MELGVRDWMIIVGVLLIATVLLDGYRRIRNEQRGKIRMSLNKQFLNTSESYEDHSCELPNGGARVVERQQTVQTTHDPYSSRYSQSSHGPAMGGGQLDLEQTVPMLMESVASGQAPADQSVETVVSQAVVSQEVLSTGVAAESSSSSSSYSSSPHSSPSQNSSPQNKGGECKQELMVINLVAKDEPFKGPDLLHILLACDLRYGEMNIFHRHERANGNGAVQFSLANSVEPGTFELDNIDDFTTTGVCFFMSVPGPEHPIKAFDYMVETAQCLMSNLNGEMLDESRSAMTNQTLEHCRQRIQEFERRQLAQHA
ncbi:MAG: cell division protein ZipA [Pseudomonadales bacterium]